jgi:choice-of-anchor C domain-containing protein
MTGAVMAVAALSGSAMAADPVALHNGSFEDGAYTRFQANYDFARVPAGSTDLAGWTITGGGIDWVGTYWQAAQGSKSIDLDGSEAAAPGGISQTVDTKVGSTYVVTYNLSGNPDSGPADKTMTVNIGGINHYETYNTSGFTRAEMQWVPVTYSFVATSTQTPISFMSTTEGGYGAVIDNVVITETLKTGADCKKGGWQTMKDSLDHSFRNQGDCVSFYATGEKNLAY